MSENNNFLEILDNLRKVDKMNINRFSREELEIMVLVQKEQIEQYDYENRNLNKEISYLKSDPKYLKYLSDFVAIDFETATTGRMACQIGLVVVKNYEIIDEYSFLIQPPGNKYDYNCIMVHRITPNDTFHCPFFYEIWDKIGPIITSAPIVAHNASFDIDVLKKNCEYYNIPVPELTYYCTCAIHNKLSLEETCKLYDIEIGQRHNALYDARSCANLFIKYCKIHTVTDGHSKGDKKNQKVKNDSYFSDPARVLSSEAKVQDLTQVKDKDNFLYNKKIVISGIFERFPSREDLAKLLKSYGADINGSISSKTNLFIFGSDYGPAKMEKAQSLVTNGANLELLDELKLYEILDSLT